MKLLTRVFVLALLALSSLVADAQSVLLFGTVDPEAPLPASCGRNGPDICRPFTKQPLEYTCEVTGTCQSDSYLAEGTAKPKDFSYSGPSGVGCIYTWSHIGWAGKGTAVYFGGSPNSPQYPIYQGNTELQTYWIASRTSTCTDYYNGLDGGLITRTAEDIAPSVQGKRVQLFSCPAGYAPAGNSNGLYTHCKLIALDIGNKGCHKNGTYCGDPINLGSGNAYSRISDIIPTGRGHARFGISYNSESVSQADDQTYAPTLHLGLGWTHDYGQSVAWDPIKNVVGALRGNGDQLLFFGQGAGLYLPISGKDDFIRQTFDAGNQPTGWLYYDIAGGAIEVYENQGKFVSKRYAAGGFIQLSYSSGLLSSIADEFGIGVTIASQIDPNSGTNFTTGIADVAGQQYAFNYDSARNLARIDFPDGLSRRFSYGEAITIPGLTTDIPANYLTSVYDEAGVQFERFGYYGAKAVYNDLAGGVQSFKISYTLASSGAVKNSQFIDSLGRTNKYGVNVTQGRPYPSSEARFDSAGNSLSARAFSYDARGNRQEESDFNQNKICRAFDANRNLETSRIEGVSVSTACSALTTDGATLPLGSRKVTTVWHPDWMLAAKLAEPGKLTTNVYNGQADPFNGEAVASCASNGAPLPDGKPIVVLCKRVEQATTDADGHLGFGATPQSGVASRVQQWSYTAYGQVLTATDPLNHSTTYTYYTDTSFTGADPNAEGHTIGDLQSVTNPVGKVTNYTKYNKYGQVLQSMDPNGVVTTNTYDLRQRLLSATAGTETTSYSYDPMGQLVTVTLPSGAVITNTYDAAHRLIQTTDAAGNKVVYTLDNAGNRVNEQVQDASGTLVKSIARTFNALGKLQSVAGAAQ